MTEVHPEPPATVVVTTNQTPVVVTTSPVAGPEVTQPGGYTVSVTTAGTPSTTVAPASPATVVVDTPAVPAAREVYVQQADPGMTAPGIWWQTNPDGSLKTLWVEDGV